MISNIDIYLTLKSIRMSYWVFRIWALFRDHIFIFELRWVSSWSFATTQWLIFKNNFYILKAKPVISRFWKYKFYTAFLCFLYKFWKMSKSMIQLLVQIFVNICGISPILKTLILFSTFLFWRIYELIYHIFHIAVCWFVGLQCSL